jgi:hypothetical protein
MKSVWVPTLALVTGEIQVFALFLRKEFIVTG